MEPPAPPRSRKRKLECLEPHTSTSVAGSELADDVICTICNEYLTDPVILECGDNFCRTCIIQHCKEEKKPSCPSCGERFQKRAFKSNKTLGRVVQFIKQWELNLEKRRRADRNVCVDHGKELVWFCKQDTKFLCEDCKESPAHGSHFVVPAVMASHQSKGQASTPCRSKEVTAQGLEDISPQQQELTAMASAHPLRKLLEEAVCPICKDYFDNPVIIDCGHKFCQACIMEHYRKSEVEPQGVCCPQCRTKLKKEDFLTHKQLPSMVENIQPLGGKAENLRMQIVCRRHEEKIRMFCEEDGVICLGCAKPQEHSSHALVSIEKAAQKYQEKLLNEFELLKKEMEEISQLESKEQTKPKDWEVRVKCHRWRILVEFEKLQLFLKEQQKLFLQRLEKEETETLKKLNENVTKLSQQSSLLQQVMTEIEKKCQQPAADLLMDVKDTLARSEQVRLQKPELTDAELKAVYRVPGMLEMLREFTVNVTLDPDTANPNLVLSEDRKCVRFGDTAQDLPDKPERFDTYLQVLGAERFTGGRHYWEVDVSEKTRWNLGVCRDSVIRKGRVRLASWNGYWTIWLRKGKYQALTCPSVSLTVHVRPKKVGIFLDYEAGEVSFYNVTDRSHLFTFTDTFSETLCPHFSLGSSKDREDMAPLTICPVPY